LSANPDVNLVNHALGMYLMKKAGEFGATTGRPRRVGWLDIPALNHAVRVNGLTHLALTKLDSLGDLPEVQLVTKHRTSRGITSVYDLYALDEAEPLTETFKGWSKDEVRKARSWDELPENAQLYVNRIIELTNTPVCSIGVGPDRTETITLYNPFD